MRRFVQATAAVIALALPSAGLAQEGRAVLRVPADFATIQQAVNAASEGDLIFVEPGTYCEQVVITTNDVRLRASAAVGTDRAVLTGACSPGGFGFYVRGTATAPVSGVEISGFVIEGFDTGIVLEYATHSRVRLNEVRANVYQGSSTPGIARGQGILLLTSSENEIAQNYAHHNGHLGIGLRNASNDNVVRGNRLEENQAQLLGPCSLMIWGPIPSTRNRIVENEVIATPGVAPADWGGGGIMIGPSPQIGNYVAQNRVHGHNGEGIMVMPGSTMNVIEQNDARDNGLAGWNDLWDGSTTNLWQNNLGTCAPGNAGC